MSTAIGPEKLTLTCGDHHRWSRDDEGAGVDYDEQEERRNCRCCWASDNLVTASAAGEAYLFVVTMKILKITGDHQIHTRK